MKIVILAGGVGGARMARGFAALETLEPTVVVNVGDDDTIYFAQGIAGLWIGS